MKHKSWRDYPLTHLCFGSELLARWGSVGLVPDLSWVHLEGALDMLVMTALECCNNMDLFITRITVATTGGLLEAFAEFLFAKLPVLLDRDTGTG